jgi:hypothetical protein
LNTRLPVSAAEAGQIVGPPESLQRHDCIVKRFGPVLQHEFQGIRHDVERFDRLGIGWSGIRVARAVNHEKRQLRRLDDRWRVGRLAIEPLRRLLHINARHD